MAGIWPADRRHELAQSPAAAAWIFAAGLHHTCLGMALGRREHLEAFAEMAGLKLLVIGNDTSLADFKREIRANETYYYLAGRR
jgi:L-arabinose isomerase